MSIRSLLDMFAVLGCKAGGILVNLVFLPLYQRMLSPTDFGIVALVISFQALLTIVDLGTSTLLARDMSAASATGDFRVASQTWRVSELVFVLLSVTAMIVAGGITAFSSVSGEHESIHRFGAIAFAIALFLSFALNNLCFTALNALQSYRVASLVQMTGVLVRAGATVVALRFWASNFFTFIVVQAIAAVLHLVVARAMLVRELAEVGAEAGSHGRISECVALVSRAKPLILMGVSAALATQLDKTIVSLNISLSAVGPYFLAYTYALMPASVLGAPLSQYFFPKIVAHVVNKTEHSHDALNTARYFGTAISVITVLPSGLLFLYCRDWVGIWLHHSSNVATTAPLARIFVVAGVLASLNFAPTVLLNAIQDYKYVAVVSTTLMVPLLTAIWLFTARQDLTTVVWVYVAYYAVLIGSFYRRATRSSCAPIAKASLKIMVVYAAGLIAMEALISVAIALVGIPLEFRHWVATAFTGAVGLALFAYLSGRFTWFGPQQLRRCAPEEQ